MTTPVIYDISIGKHKPHSGTQTSCPFCHRETLTDILDEKGDIIWLMNKYPVFRNTYPTVIIESAVHEADLTEYTKEKARQVISFGLEKWNLLERDPRFRSVIYFRNYGPESGGSQRHPHSQIIGLEDYDYRDNIDRENFLGTIFHEDENCFASLSSYPICGMGELNVTLKTDGCTDTFADTIQKSQTTFFMISLSPATVIIYFLPYETHPCETVPPLYSKSAVHGVSHYPRHG